MPSPHEVRTYLYGIWLLLKGDPAGLNLLDTSKRGVWHSFWAVAWVMPVYLIMWTHGWQEYRIAFPDTDETTVTFFAKSALVGLGDMLLPIAGLAIGLMLLKKRSLFRPLVVIWNWGGVVALYIGLALLLALIFPQEPLEDPWWSLRFYGLFVLFAVYVALLFIAIWRILRTVVGGSLFLRLAIFANLSLPLLLLTPLEKRLGIDLP